MTLPFPHVEGKLLSAHCTFGIGGPARFFARAKTIEEMVEMLSHCHKIALPFFILGKGSNTLFDDRGYNGLVILNCIDTMEQNECRVTVGSG